LSFAFFVGSLVKALIYKGLAAVQQTYQQSYPQKFWMSPKSFMNQRLKSTFASSLQERTPNQALT
jgi:hypothetical protein